MNKNGNLVNGYWLLNTSRKHVYLGFIIGKSSFISGLLIEHEYHFENEIKKILYFFREEDETIRSLREHFDGVAGIDVKFAKKIPENLSALIIKNGTILVFDDFESYFSSKINSELLYSIASVWTSHLLLHTFFCVQSFNVLKKQSKAHPSFQNSTHVCFFKNNTEARALKRYMSNFSIPLKNGLSVWETYQKYVQKKPFAYLLLCISPRFARQTAYSNILHASKGHMMSFHDSSDSE